jgi:hypothetical protein
MPRRDDIGIRGQSIFVAQIMQFCGRDRPFFTPYFLGDKFPTVDYIVELNDTSRPMHFFAHVRSTRRGYTRDVPARLKVQVTKSEVRRLIAFPAPAYVFGIDEQGEEGYIVAVDKPRTVTSITTTHPLDCSTLQLLWTEVKLYWESRNPQMSESRFTD